VRVVDWVVKLEHFKETARISLTHAQGSPLFLQLIRYYGSVVELYTSSDTLMYLHSSMLKVELSEIPSEIKDDGLVKDLSYDRDWYNQQYSNEFSSFTSKQGHLIKIYYNLSDPSYGDMSISFSREERAEEYKRIEDVEGFFEPPFLMLPHIP